MAYKNIKDRRAYHRQYMRERREWLAAHHLCTECGKEDARTMIGKKICFNCFERNKGHSPKINLEPKPKRIWQKHDMPRSEYYAHGLCAICGQHPHLPDKRVCQSCYDSTCRGAWLGRKAQGQRAVRPPCADTEKAIAAYQFCIEHRQEYLERWYAEYGVEAYEQRASNQEQGTR